MSTNDRPNFTGYSHPADDPAQIEAMRMALALRDMPVARLVARDILGARLAWERERHPAGRGACDPEEGCCDGCARAYSEPWAEPDGDDGAGEVAS